MELKKCTKCGEEKPRTAEYFSRCKRYGLAQRCKMCAKSYYESKRQQILEQKKSYHSDNKEKILVQKKEYYKTNKEKVMKRRKSYLKQDDTQKMYEAYRKENKEILREKSVLWAKNRRETDPVFKVTDNLRGRIKRAFHGISKSAKTLELIGCSREHLRKHLEDQFVPGMTWDNYGPVWHIDHIKPFAAFDNLLDEMQQREACHYTNLQPLFAEDNLRKHAKWTG